MGFFQLGAKPSSHGGLSQFAQTPFGNLQSPSNFQQLLWNILVLFLWIFAFNTVIYFFIFGNHLDHLCQVLGAIEGPGATLATSKHLFEYQSFLPLKKRALRSGLSPHKERVDAILRIEFPRNLHSLQVFWEIIAHFFPYIPSYTWNPFL
jgi:hypothetical protein